MSVLPCRDDPEKWFSRDRRLLGEAVHACRVHCPWLGGCRAEPAPVMGVLAGVLYTRLGVPDTYQPDEVKCLACDPPPSLHGSLAGFARHRRAKEKPCIECRAAATAAERERRRKLPPKEKPPPVDVLEGRRRQVVIEERRQVVDDALATRWKRGA